MTLPDSHDVFTLDTWAGKAEVEFSFVWWQCKVISTNALKSWNAEPSWLIGGICQYIFFWREVFGWILVDILVSPYTTVVSRSWKPSKIVTDDTLIIT